MNSITALSTSIRPAYIVLVNLIRANNLRLSKVWFASITISPDVFNIVPSFNLYDTFRINQYQGNCSHFQPIRRHYYPKYTSIGTCYLTIRLRA